MTKHQKFLKELTQWYAVNKRSLPFRGLKDPYKIWVSEVLLQQTQMSRGVEYYLRFIKRFPTVQSLAKVSWAEFLPYFQGLGYYNRGRNTLKAAQLIVQKFKGKFPGTKQELLQIPGVGPYTADAILAFAFDQPVLPLDTNVERILGRVFLGKTKLDKKTDLEVIEKLLKSRNVPWRVPTGVIAQAMMDFGSAICINTKPHCLGCPFQKTCLYFQKEQPHLQKKSRMVREKYERKYVQAEIYDGKKLLKHRGKLLGGYLERGDERAFLKQLAQAKMGLTISVRPAYKKWIEKGVRYSLHRCYVLDFSG